MKLLHAKCLRVVLLIITLNLFLACEESDDEDYKYDVTFWTKFSGQEIVVEFGNEMFTPLLDTITLSHEIEPICSSVGGAKFPSKEGKHYWKATLVDSSYAWSGEIIVGNSECNLIELEIPHIVADWILQEMVIINVPMEYSYSESTIYSPQDLSIESYSLDMSISSGYVRILEYPNSSIIEERGLWKIASSSLFLEPNDGPNENFDILKNVERKLWLSQPYTWYLVSNAIQDTITDDFLDELFSDGLTDEELELLFDEVDVDLVHVFEK